MRRAQWLVLYNFFLKMVIFYRKLKMSKKGAFLITMRNSALKINKFRVEVNNTPVVNRLQLG